MLPHGKPAQKEIVFKHNAFSEDSSGQGAVWEAGERAIESTGCQLLDRLTT